MEVALESLNEQLSAPRTHEPARLMIPRNRVYGQLNARVIEILAIRN
jgi:hypothetical protein